MNQTYSPLTLAEKLSKLPNKPGIYQFKNADGTVIYVGKAKNLKNRVKSYFQERPMDAKTKALIRHIHDIELIVTDTETEALLLENNLIKECRPKYNILLKDDKSYPYIRITNELFPRLFSTRTIIRDGSKYFGPYTDGRYLQYLLKTIRSLFPIRSCDLPLTENTINQKKYKVCLDYHIKKCEGPCEGFTDHVSYNTYMMQATMILNGKTKVLEQQIEQQMLSAADNLQFEEATLMRNRLTLLREYTGKQKVVVTDLIDRDIFALSIIDEDACIMILNIREGKMIGKTHYFISDADEKAKEEMLRIAIEKYYLESEHIPEEIYLPFPIIDEEYSLDWLSEKKGESVHISIPKIGDKRKIISMAETNAAFMLRELHLQKALKDQALPRGVASLQKDLRLESAPRKIECFDNSHMQGTDYVSSMVVFLDGKPKKSAYRTYKIQSFVGNDDFAAMREVIKRRYNRAVEEQQELPDLIVIDGGKGQLSAAVEILQSIEQTKQIPVIGLAKRLEEIFFPHQSESLLLPRTSTGLRLLQNLRDEAHRFAITFHRKLRDKRTLQTELTTIPGIGPKTAEKLLVHFGSVKGVKNATPKDWEECIGKKGAELLLKGIQQL